MRYINYVMLVYTFRCYFIFTIRWLDFCKQNPPPPPIFLCFSTDLKHWSVQKMSPLTKMKIVMCKLKIKQPNTLLWTNENLPFWLWEHIQLIFKKSEILSFDLIFSLDMISQAFNVYCTWMEGGIWSLNGMYSTFSMYSEQICIRLHSFHRVRRYIILYYIICSRASPPQWQ